VSPNLISTFVLAGHWTIIVGLSIRVIMRRAPIGISLAWLTVVFSVPLGGAVLYLLFGEKRLGARRRQRLGENSRARATWLTTLCDEYRDATLAGESLGESLERQAQEASGFPVLPANALELLAGHEAFFDRLIHDIDRARIGVDLAFYIWHPGGRVDDVANALVRATRRGVRCRALADAVGSKAFSRSETFARLCDAGIELVDTLPTGLFRMLFARADLRNHRKIVVIDEHIAYAGSQNMVDPRFFKLEADVGEWVDAMVRIAGPAAMALDSVFGLDWAVETGTEFAEPASFSAGAGSGARRDTLVQIVPSGPDAHPEAIHWSLLTAIYSARHEIVLSTPYFVPDESILTAFLSASRRGVAVTLIVPARNDSMFVRHASVAHYDELMAAGVRIARFTGGLLHTKSMTVDGEVSLFGSVNLDMRSFWLNFEISLIVYDREFARRLRSLQDSYLGSSEWVDPEAWSRRPARAAFVANTFRLLGPLI
jgi:cardiolipin synthase A/B